MQPSFALTLAAEESPAGEPLVVTASESKLHEGDLSVYRERTGGIGPNTRRSPVDRAGGNFLARA